MFGRDRLAAFRSENRDATIGKRESKSKSTKRKVERRARAAPQRHMTAAAVLQNTASLLPPTNRRWGSGYARDVHQASTVYIRLHTPQ